MPSIEMTNVIEGALGGYTVAGAPVAGTDEVQTLTIGGTPDGGTFKLAFDGQTTGDIEWTDVDATLITAIDTALEALSNIPTGGVTTVDTTMSSGIGACTITFTGALAKRNVALITVAENALTGTDPTVAVALTTAGVDATALSARIGALLTDTTNGELYITTTTNPPTWVLVGSQS